MKEVSFKTINDYTMLYGLETLHPLVSVIDLTQAKHIVNHVRTSYGLYALYLKFTKDCNIKYGRKTYDYKEGTVVSFAPGQIAEIETITDEVQPKVYGIIFHPDIIRGTTLGNNIKNYHFFSYTSTESLHLSEAEQKIFLECLSNINQELEHGKDKHSKALISRNIELLLDYCQRFYERQFKTREYENKDVIQQFENLFDKYFESGEQYKYDLPTVRYFAERVFLSPNYFGDLIKKETGKSAQEYIQYKIVEVAKDKLLNSNKTISEIAYELGFRYPQHFSRFFKQQEGVTPTKYRHK